MAIDPEPDPDEVVGDQNERTALAWRRTALACLVAGALAARHLGGWVGLATLLAVAAGSGGVDLHSQRRYRRRVAWLARAEPVASPEDVVALGVVVLGLAGISLAAVLV